MSETPTIQHPGLRAIADRVWQRQLEQSPFLQVRLRIPVTRIPNPSLAEAQAEVDFARAALAELEALDADSLSYDDRLTYLFVQDALQQQMRSVEMWWSSFPVTPYNGYWMSMYGQIIFGAFQFTEAADAERYLSLLNDYALALRSLLDKLRAQASHDWRIPRPALPGVIASLTGLKAAVTAMLSVHEARLTRLGTDAARRLAADVQRALENEIAPGFDALLASVDADYASKAPEGVGLGQYDGGEAAYRMWVRYHVTYDIEPERIHQIGLEQVQLLTDAMREAREAQGFHGTEEEYRAHLKAMGRLHASSAEEVEARLMRHIARLEPLVPQYFLVLPEAPYKVERLPPALEAGMTYGYYDPPTDTREEGVYFYNGSGLDTRSQLNAAALIFHELIPGHHFHIARQYDNLRLHPLRRMGIGISAYNEGWAEYASELPREMGLYDDPADWYGRLVHQRFTAQRLVVDTGMNLLGWSLERGREFMRANTMEAETQVATETLRYSTDMPGQALAYRLGYLKMAELRAKAEAALGAAFDLRAFHEAILGPGALPLNVLDQHIAHFIQQAQEARGR